MKKLVCLVMAIVMVAALFATGVAEEKTFKVGVCQLAVHPALDAASEGFMDTLKEMLENAGYKVDFDYQIAAGESSTCNDIANRFVSADVDLMMANATGALTACSSITGTIPVLGTSISDYATALVIEDWTGVTGINVSGTSDLAPIDGQAAIFAELFPEAKTIGMLYCSGEANSSYQVSLIKSYLEPMGYTCVDYAFSDTSDIYSVAVTALSKSDVVYVPTDNAAAASTEALRNAVETEMKPIVAGEEGICSGCGVATLSISYYDLGVATGKMAYEVLVNGADVATMPVQFAEASTKKYNAELCDLLGIVVPEDYVAID